MRFSSRLFAAFALTFLAACSSSVAPESESENDHVRQASAPLIEDVTSMVQRSDGKFDVLCKNGTHEVATTADILSNRVCSGTTAPLRCVKNCSARWSDGSCKSFTADYCAPNATCIAHCTERWSDGSCKNFGTDFCRAGEAVCTSVCGSRWSDGSCKSFADDHCGAGEYVCVKQCAARWSDGSCKTLGNDFCKERTPGSAAPACIENCTARWSDGSCKAYGVDICN